MPIPQLSQELIRSHANNKSWQRGETYYHNDYVRQVVQRGNRIVADVDGSDIELYKVNIEVEKDKLGTVYCSCPYSFGGYCKHIVAALLVCLREPERIEQRSSLETILDRLNEVQTQALIQELVADNPALIDDIEYFADRVAPSAPTKSSSESPTQKKITVNVNSIRSKVRYILRDAVSHYEYGGEEDPATEEISSLIQDAQMYTQRGDTVNAIAMLEAITNSCIENWDLVDDYGVDPYEVASELNTVWCETIFSADIPEAEKVDLGVSLEFWNNEWDGSFDTAIAALKQGWDDPELTQILAGNISDYIAAEEEYPYDDGNLTLIRLQILEREKRFTEYLHLAEAKGQVTKYLNRLVRLDRVAEAMAKSQSQMQTMEQALALYEVLVESQNAQSEALEIANRGLNLPGYCQYKLATWASEIALKLDDLVSAKNAKVKAFQAQPNFDDYKTIEKLATEDWSTIREELLAELATASSWGTDEAKVDIYLYESMIDKAIAVVTDTSSYRDNLVHKVMTAAISTHSNWVISNACRRAESIMNEGKAKYYEYAIAWLKQVRAAYLASERKREWTEYREKIVSVHGRKRKLMGLMKSVV